jgi:hypothetical protein
MYQAAQIGRKEPPLSNNPYASPDEADLDREIRIAQLQWVMYSRWILIFVGLFYVGLGAVIPLFYGSIAFVDPEIGPEMAPFLAAGGLCAALFIWGFSVPMFAAAWGLKRGKKWAWVVTLIVGAMLAPSACLPLGAALLYGMLQDPVRKEFVG